jgi:hypothetical protein
MKDREAAIDRRNFLRKASAGTVIAGAALATPLMRSAQADNESENEKRKARYRVSDDVKAYYRVNRYPK